MPENLVMTSGVTPFVRLWGYTVRTDSGGRVKKFSRVGMGVPGIYIAVWFGAKLTILWATNGVAQVKV